MYDMFSNGHPSSYRTIYICANAYGCTTATLHSHPSHTHTKPIISNWIWSLISSPASSSCSNLLYYSRIHPTSQPVSRCFLVSSLLSFASLCIVTHYTTTNISLENTRNEVKLFMTFLGCFCKACTYIYI